MLNELCVRRRRRVLPGPPQEKKKGRSESGQEACSEVDLLFYHLRVTVIVGVRVGSGGRQGGGQRAGVGGHVVLVVVVRLGGPLRVTAGQEVGARPGHSGFLFGAGAAHLLPGNHSNRSTLYI